MKYDLKYKIGKIVKPVKYDWLTEDKIKEYLKQQFWENLENAVIDGFIWTQYLNKYDYKNVYLKDVEGSKEDIIKQIIEQLNPEKMTQFSSTEHANDSHRKSINEYREDILKIEDIRKRNSNGEKVTPEEIQWLCYKLTYRTSQLESSLYDR